ncbi:PpiC-type peptidyl-prolyl cis-trans isomerase [Nitrosococcus halophilus Nc 4]|uniref:peptidylprolyl isomerase n=1 Tax=Nitrosococcus halophilus (strain Nc4) TaxID=472759 RepID=D5C2M3_NITHN|nr:peptidylprolyl isomerase [Nitrosococcus halophilus]ADE16698.1 PpiC-type peptidyl-prolyl cis-trans isomerase [Nitrosococcus halophilus Nc 4]
MQILAWVGYGLLFLMTVGASAVAAETPEAVSVSPQLRLTAEDYRRHLSGVEAKQWQGLTGDRERLRDLALDFHSNWVLAAEAEDLGLAEDPKVAAQLRAVRRQVLARALMKKVAGEAAVPSDRDLKALARERYSLHKDKLRTAEKRRVAHILLAEPADCPCDERPPARERAAALRRELLAGGDFGAAARERSRDKGTAPDGGELPGWIKRDGRLVKPFEDAAFALTKPGDISKPVETPFGVHLIKLLEVKPSRQLSFEEVKGKLMRQVRAEVRASAMEQKRSQSYPDPRKINYEVLEQVVNELQPKGK